MTLRILYISGPMTGYPDYNYPAFDSAKKLLLTEGYTVLSPHDIQYDEGGVRGSLPYSVYMRHGLKLLLECEGIYMLDGWSRSKGAMLEYEIAKVLDLVIMGAYG